jgi:phage-related protein
MIKIIFSKESKDFLNNLNDKVRNKILYNARKVSIVNDSEIFKKLDGEIWELRTIYEGLCYRFLAFWDKRDNKNTLVIATHGFIKKTQKTPKEEINKAEKKRKEYFANN